MPELHDTNDKIHLQRKKGRFPATNYRLICSYGGFGSYYIMTCFRNDATCAEIRQFLYAGNSTVTSDRKNYTVGSIHLNNGAKIYPVYSFFGKYRRIEHPLLRIFEIFPDTRA